ncbi:MAG: LuxR C-terminal-related transcriptional regulator, partial [Candidatus Baltobacteraceae bacterium]
ATSARVLEIIRNVTWTSHNEVQTLHFVSTVGALTEAICGRVTSARRTLRKPLRAATPGMNALKEAVAQLIRLMESQAAAEGFLESLEPLRLLGFGGYASLFEAISKLCPGKADSGEGRMTRSELEILRFLAAGLGAKAIAEETGRSVYTIQAHIRNIIEKLGCRGRQEALAVARSQGLIA